MSTAETKLWVAYVKDHNKSYDEYRNREMAYNKARIKAIKEYKSKSIIHKMVTTNPWNNPPYYVFNLPEPTLEGFMNWKAQKLLAKSKKRAISEPSKKEE